MTLQHWLVLIGLVVAILVEAVFVVLLWVKGPPEYWGRH